LIFGNVQIAKKNKEKYQQDMEVYKQTKEEEAMSLKKEEEEMMKFQKQEAMQISGRAERQRTTEVCRGRPPAIEQDGIFFFFFS